MFCRPCHYQNDLNTITEGVHFNTLATYTYRQLQKPMVNFTLNYHSRVPMPSRRSGCVSGTVFHLGNAATLVVLYGQLALSEAWFGWLYFFANVNLL
jgi:hypothetical protein